MASGGGEAIRLKLATPEELEMLKAKSQKFGRLGAFEKIDRKWNQWVKYFATASVRD
jgi:hypothetical protein